MAKLSGLSRKPPGPPIAGRNSRREGGRFRPHSRGSFRIELCRGSAGSAGGILSIGRGWHLLRVREPSAAEYGPCAGTIGRERNRGAAILVAGARPARGRRGRACVL